MNHKKLNRPPWIARCLLKYIFPDQGEYTSLGDFEEVYNQIAIRDGVIKARVWYWAELMRSLPGYIKNKFYRGLNMFKSYLKITIRNMKKHKGYSFINVTGLAVGMACCILIFLWVRDELSYDRFHENINRLCRVVRSERSPDGTVTQFAGTSRPVGPSLKESYPEIIEYSRFYNLSRRLGRVLLEYKNKRFYENRFCFADPSFFSIFGFSFIQGDQQSALTQPNSVVFTQEMAKKYFGKEDPLGKTLTLKNWCDITVSGVIENIPANSHLQFDFICPIGPLFERYSWMKGWRIPHFFTYLLLDKNVDIQQVNKKIRYHIKDFDPEKYKLFDHQYSLQPVRDIHLHSHFKADLNGDSEIQSVFITFFSAIASFVLIIACANFINLTTARSSIRAREIGVRKVIGANRSNIARQFFGESLLMTFLSLGAAIIFVIISLPTFNMLSGKQMVYSHLFNLDILLGIVVIAVITGILSGFYPAFVLSSFQPVCALKGTRVNVRESKLLRRILVIMQFSLSLILIIGTLIVYRQLDYIQNKNLGYDREFLFYFAKQGSLIRQYDAFKDALLKNTQILGVTTSSDLPVKTSHYTTVSGWEGSTSEDGMLMNFFSVDEDYIKTFDIEMAEGRFFSKAVSTDATEAYVVNQEAVDLMGMTNPIGKRLLLFGREGRIIGVMRNFHFESFHQQIEPLIFWINPRWDRYIFVRIRSGRIAENLHMVERIHQKFNPEYPFDFKFLSKDIDQLYETELRTKRILQLFTGFAILISCIGLFGLAAFMVMQRTKEIGIRKVLGATVGNVVVFLSKEFIKWIFIANLIGWPLAYIIMNNWLMKFAYRIEIGIWVFLLPGILILLISIFTVSFHTIKAAWANPVDALKYE